MAKKLKPEEYEEIRQLYYAGETMGNIAKKKQISKWHVEHIIGGRDGGKQSGLYIQRKRNEPAGGLTPEMIAETASRVHVGGFVIIPFEIEEAGYLVKKKRICEVTGTYRRVFTYRNGKTTGSSKYVDILIGDVKIC